jgi:hypothetical protein
MKVPDKVRKKQDEELEISKTVSPECYGTVLFYPELENNQKEWKKLVFASEKLVRKSIECKNYIQYLKDELDLDSCHFLSNISIDQGVDIELHHYPFSLYDITEIVLRKRIAKGEVITSFAIANEVVALHYKGLIGLVPLSKTAHQLAHSGDLFIPLGAVFGGLKEFLESYGKFISTNLFQSLESIFIIPESMAEDINNVLKEEIVFNETTDQISNISSYFKELENKVKKDCKKDLK